MSVASLQHKVALKRAVGVYAYDSVKQDCVRVWDLALTLWDIINHGYKVRSCNISLFLA